jgi:hypothetical protein
LDFAAAAFFFCPLAVAGVALAVRTSSMSIAAAAPALTAASSVLTYLLKMSRFFPSLREIGKEMKRTLAATP